MQQWEYLMDAVPQQALQKTLAKYGKDGWELTSAMTAALQPQPAMTMEKGILVAAPVAQGPIPGVALIFKRPLETHVDEVIDLVNRRN